MQPSARSIEVALAGCCLGVIIPAALPVLPSPNWLPAIGVVGCLVMWWPPARWLGCGLLASAWACVQMNNALDQQIKPCLSGKDIHLVGTIAGLPEPSQGGVQFYLDVQDAAIAGCPERVRGRLRMSWYDAPVPVSAGERWSFIARLKPIHGHVNPGGFDYERWALSRHLRGSGYIKSGQRLQAMTRPSADVVRAAVRREVVAAGLKHPGILLALATGDASLISTEDWDTFRATGTVHLLVISGLHLGFVAGMGWWIGRLTPLLAVGLARRWPRQWTGFAGALAAASSYGALAGWTLPVWRSWLMVVVSLAWLAAGRRLSLTCLYLLVMTFVVGLDPLATLDTGFWLSFGAVGVLLIAFGPRQGQPPIPRVVSWGRDLIWAQLALFAAMAVLLATTMGQIPIGAPLVNLIAVPLVSLVLVPLVLAATVTSEALLGLGAAATFLSLADGVAELLCWWLDITARHMPLLAGGVRSVGVAALAVAASALVLLPIAPLWRCLALATIASALAAASPPVAMGEFRVTALDVGQGLSVVVDTARHRMVYDTGPRYRSGFDLGASVVVPALRATGQDNLELLIISHADNDHAGGEMAVRRLASVRTTLRGSPEGFPEGSPKGSPKGSSRCRAGDRWQWDGVRFEVLHPDQVALRAARARNNQSCVVLITNGVHVALLPGDITQTVERRLTASRRTGKVNLLVAPHHGSRTSSSQALLSAVSPAIVWFSTGYLNRFGHPDSTVVARYRRMGTRIHTTANAGALIWASDQPDRVTSWRRRAPRFWR